MNNFDLDTVLQKIHHSFRCDGIYHIELAK